MGTVSATESTSPPDPRLDRALRWSFLLGLAAVVLLPAARGSNAWLGAMPLWLLAMPAISWWALHRFHWPRMPRWPDASAPLRTRRRRTAQARRRPTERPVRRLPSLRRAA